MWDVDRISGKQLKNDTVLLCSILPSGISAAAISEWIERPDKRNEEKAKARVRNFHDS